MKEAPSEKRSEGSLQITRQAYARDIYSHRHDWDQIRPQILLRHVKTFNIEYWNPVRKDWSSSLRELNDNRFRLSVIRVFLEWVNPDGNIQEFERVFRHQWTHYDPMIDRAAYRKAKTTEKNNNNSADSGNIENQGTEQ